MLKQKLEDMGIKAALEELGYEFDEIFSGLSKEAQELYASYDWRKIPCAVEGIRHGYVVHAVPPEELLESGYPWEEWFFQFDRPEHHVLFLEKKENCDQEILIPADDVDHPKEACGRMWYYFGDAQSFPYYKNK